ncbi:MAG: hypothetical protein ACRCZM_09525 [Bacteroidales bacterium]
MDNVWTLLMFALPSGFIGSIIGWLTSRRSRVAQTNKEEHDIYKQMYNDVKESVRQQKKEYEEIYARLAQLERAVRSIQGCEHYHACPVKRELRSSTQHSLRAGE